MADDSDTEIPLLPVKGTDPPKPRGCIQQRYVFTCLISLGFFNVYALRVNMSVAMVAMVNTTHSEGGNASVTTECPVDEPKNSTSDVLTGEFNWTPQEQGIILSSFFYGYLVTQLPGGLIAEKFGGKWVFGLGILSTGVLTLLTPLAARTSPYLLIVLRILEGIGEGVTPPAFHAMVGRWAPPLERSRIVTVGSAGANIGTVVSMPISGWLCKYGFAGGWPSVFYVFEHPRIAEDEKKYILTLIGHTERKTKPPTPWKGILTSLPVWSMALVHTGMSFQYLALLTELPTYMKNILHFNINESGVFSALPYLLYIFIGFGYSPFADWLLTKRYMTTRNVRRLSTALGVVFPAAFIIGTGYIGCNFYLGVALLTISVGGLAFDLSGYLSNIVDIAPNYAGTIMGIINTFGTLTGILAPLMIGAMTNNNETQAKWRIIFYIFGGFFFFSSIPYMFLAKTERASWSYEEGEKRLITDSTGPRRLSTVVNYNGRNVASE